MGEFVCKVADARGQVSVQVEEAGSEAEARSRLGEKGLLVYSVRSKALPGISWRWRPRRPSVSANDFLLFNQQFITLIRAGLPILHALDLLAERAARPNLRVLLDGIRRRVRGGDSLSEAFAAQEAFSPVYISTLLAGERSGNLAGVLDYYVSYQKVTGAVRRQLLGALVYPALLIVVAAGVLAGLITYVIPRFAELYSDMHASLPKFTLLVVNFSLGVRDSVWLLTLLALGLLAAGVVAARTQAGAQALDRLRLWLPLAGSILLRFRLAQFCRTLSTLLAGGIPVVPALEVSGGALESPVLRRAVATAVQRVREGQSLHDALARTGEIPGLVTEMIEVGETTGALPQMLTSVAEFYEEELNAQLGWVLSLVQPVLLLVVASLVAMVLVALYLPIFSVGTLVR
ncbi:MAG: type II secretion system F family protein [Candidatus Acidoferrales bacterium]